MATVARRGRAGAHAARRRPGIRDAPAARAALARAARPATSRDRDELLALVARRGQRQGGRAHRRRVGAGRAAGEAAPAEDRQAPRVGDPGGHGRGARRARRVPPRRLGHAWRVDAGRRRGRDPGDAAAGHGRRARRGPRRRHRHRADAGAARRGRRPRAQRAIQDLRKRRRASTSTTGSSSGSTAPSDAVAGRTCRAVAAETLADVGRAGPPPADGVTAGRARRVGPGDRDAARSSGGRRRAARDAPSGAHDAAARRTGSLFLGLAAIVVVARPADQGLADARSSRRARRCRSSATTSALVALARTTAALFGLFQRPGARVRRSSRVGGHRR